MIVPMETIAGRRILFAMALGQEYLTELSRRFVPLFVGVGPIEAGIAMGGALARLADAGALPDAVVSLGSAGSRRRPLGSIHQISRVLWRDMDASRLGFERGVTPFADHGRWIDLLTPLPGVPHATLSTGADIVGGDDYDAIDADLVDMETFAIARACMRHDIPLIGLRGVSDGPGELEGIDGWTALLHALDARLAHAVDALAAIAPRLAGRGHCHAGAALP